VLPWWLLASAFILAEYLVIHLRFGREAFSLSLSEVPLAVGLVFAGPMVLLVARVISIAILLIAARTSPAKLAFNLTVAFIETCLALWWFDLLAGSGSGTLIDWRAAFIAIIGSQLFSQAAVLVVLRLHGLPWSVKVHVLLPVAGAVINTTLGAVAVLLMASDIVAGLLLLVVGTFVAVVAYRSYNRLREQHESLTLLQTLTHTVGSDLDEGLTAQTLLQETRKLLRCEVAEIVLRSESGDPRRLALGAGTDEMVEATTPLDPVLQRLIDGRQAMVITQKERRAGLRAFLASRSYDDAVVAPLQAPSGAGVLIVGNRLGARATFSQQDVQLLQTVADHARVLLENGSLIQQLRLQIAEKEHQATHDALTGLANRSRFSALVAEAIRRATPSDESVGVLLLDLNRFKEVNDTLGHHVGDLLLQQVAERFREVLRAADVIARLGGDEFCVLLSDVTTAECVNAAQRAREALEQPFHLAGIELFVGASVGIAMYPDHADRPELLLQRADVAMYAAKRTHENCVVYESRLDEHSHQSLSLAAALRAALDARELQVHYQPKADVASGRVVGVEALVRWIHPDRGFVPPDEFIPIAEHTGLIGPLTEQVFDQAISQLLTWHAAGRHLHVAVNVSAATILAADFVSGLRARLEQAQLPRHSLTLEITESQVMADPERAAAVLDALRNLGVRVSIDDFGTGYSSLSQLKRLPVDELKIDRSFVFGMCGDPDDAVIVRSTIELAHNLGLEVVAEGVEDAQTWDELVRLGCDLAQGYYLSRPVPATELTEWLEATQSVSVA
jgi:diguanylate cyclase (GGDEF)-like protein